MVNGKFFRNHKWPGKGVGETRGEHRGYEGLELRGLVVRGVCVCVRESCDSRFVRLSVYTTDRLQSIYVKRGPS